MRKMALALWALCAAGAAQAQDSGLAVTAGVRAWYMEWTTFSYYPGNGAPNVALTQSSANDKLVVMPSVSVRYADLFGSFSAMPSTRFRFDDGSDGRRSEFDANAGYAVMPGLALTLGYKRVSQSGGAGRYRPGGPVVGASANAPLGGGVSLYGSLGIGRLRTPGGDAINFKAGYRLAEVGLACTLNADRPRWTLTGGYRIQVLSSRDAFEGQDGRDTTQGFTVGASATF